MLHSNSSPPSPVCPCSSSFDDEEHKEVRRDGLCELLPSPSSHPLLCSDPLCSAARGGGGLCMTSGRCDRARPRGGAAQRGLGRRPRGGDSGSQGGHLSRSSSSTGRTSRVLWGGNVLLFSPPSLRLSLRVFSSHRGSCPDIWGVIEEDAKMDQAFGALVGGRMGHEHYQFKTHFGVLVSG
jgi:hypothetical protein